MQRQPNGKGAVQIWSSQASTSSTPPQHVSAVRSCLLGQRRTKPGASRFVKIEFDRGVIGLMYVSVLLSGYRLCMSLFTLPWVVPHISSITDMKLETQSKGPWLAWRLRIGLTAPGRGARTRFPRGSCSGAPHGCKAKANGAGAGACLPRVLSGPTLASRSRQSADFTIRSC